MGNNISGQSVDDTSFIILLDRIKDDIERTLGKQSSKYQPIKALRQLVSGKNYFVAIQLDDEIIHVRIYAGMHSLVEKKQLLTLVFTIQTFKDTFLFMVFLGISWKTTSC